MFEILNDKQNYIVLTDPFLYNKILMAYSDEINVFFLKSCVKKVSSI